MPNQNLQTISEATGIDTDVSTWALPEGAIARLGRGKVGPLESSPDGKYLLVGTWIGLWWYELTTMQPIALWEAEGGMVSALEFSPDGTQLASASFDGTILLWEMKPYLC